MSGAITLSWNAVVFLSVRQGDLKSLLTCLSDFHYLFSQNLGLAIRSIYHS